MKVAFEGHAERLALFIANEPNDVGANGRYSSDAMAAVRAAISRAYESGGGFVVMPIATLDTLTAFYARRAEAVPGAHAVMGWVKARLAVLDDDILEFDDDDPEIARNLAERDDLRAFAAHVEGRTITPDPIFLCDDTPKAGEERSSSSSAA